MTAGAQHLTGTLRSGPGLPAAIFDFSRGKQALLTIAQPALGALLALAACPPCAWSPSACRRPAPPRLPSTR